MPPTRELDPYVMSLRLPRDMADALRAEANADERSLTWLVNRILRDHLSDTADNVRYVERNRPA